MINSDTTQKDGRFNSHIELIIMAFIFLVLFLLPVLFTRIQDQISWRHVFKIWIDHSLLFPILIINHWLLVPNQLLKRGYLTYFLCISATIGIAVLSYYYFDEVRNARPMPQKGMNRPTPIPPFADLLMYSLLIVGVDSGLLFSKKWYETEEKRHILEKKNSDMQLEILRNQVSPHFFMNTLNNIYALIGVDTPKARESMMKLSKLMRYMLYENESGKVKLSKEFEFIQSYIDLMKLRFAEEDVICFQTPIVYTDVKIPALLFISYIENAFKYGTSYENDCHIKISFDIVDEWLFFSCVNLKQPISDQSVKGGLGMENSKHRLDLLFANNYKIDINSTEKEFQVKLKIPLL